MKWDLVIDQVSERGGMTSVFKVIQAEWSDLFIITNLICRKLKHQKGGEGDKSLVEDCALWLKRRSGAEGSDPMRRAEGGVEPMESESGRGVLRLRCHVFC